MAIVTHVLLVLSLISALCQGCQKTCVRPETKRLIEIAKPVHCQYYSNTTRTADNTMAGKAVNEASKKHWHDREHFLPNDTYKRRIFREWDKIDDSN